MTEMLHILSVGLVGCRLSPRRYRSPDFHYFPLVRFLQLLDCLHFGGIFMACMALLNIIIIITYFRIVCIVSLYEKRI